MIDPREDETAEILAEAPVGVEIPEPRSKRKSPAREKAKPKRAREESAAKAPAVPAVARPAGRKIHSRQERAQKLDQIEKSVARGASLKSAVRQAGISDQTYYQWKKAAGPAPAPAGDLKDLLALEEENNRLKQLLAERLRKENAELKKKLGLE